MNFAQSYNPAPSHKATPFSRNLKGIFFFLVALIVVSQVSPLLLLNGLINQEERRVDGRLNEASTILRDAWVRSGVDGYGELDLRNIVDGHGLRRVTMAAFLKDTTGGLWHYRTIEARESHAKGWDSTSTHAPQMASDAEESDASQALLISDIWGGHPTQSRLQIATPVIATLKRQLRIELYMRGIVLTSFMLFTLLFYRSVLLPFHDMRKRAAALVESGVVPPAPGGSDKDPEYVMATFDSLVQKLSKQAGVMEQRALSSERHARDVERFNEYILTSMTTGMIILDQNGDILRFNRAAEHILRLPGEAMVGRHYSESGLPVSMIDMFEAGLKQGSAYSRHELRVEREGSEPIYLGINTSCIKSDTDVAVGLSILMTDLTAIKKLQDEVAENQRLADLGELAAGLAHQLRNSMAAILGYGRLLQKSAPADGQLGDWAHGLLAETNETSDMITRFLDFARPLHAERSTLNLVDCLVSAVNLVEAKAIEYGVVIDPITVQAGAIEADGDDLLLKQVFVNLIQNAVEASPRGAHVTVGVRGVSVGTDNGRWLVSVTDRGCGVPDDNHARIFHPFFTTKDAGTGLGLALARKIVVSHGGSLTLQNSSASGSTFLVSLPMSEEVTTSLKKPYFDREQVSS
jgi:PAS domain S-box-containing protein